MPYRVCPFCGVGTELDRCPQCTAPEWARAEEALRERNVAVERMRQAEARWDGALSQMTAAEIRAAYLEAVIRRASGLLTDALLASNPQRKHVRLMDADRVLREALQEERE